MTTEPTTTASTEHDEEALASDVRRMLSASGGDAQVLNSLLTDYEPEDVAKASLSLLAKINVAGRSAGVDFDSLLVEKPRRASDRLADRLRYQTGAPK